MCSNSSNGIFTDPNRSFTREKKDEFDGQSNEKFLNIKIKRGLIFVLIFCVGAIASITIYLTRDKDIDFTKGVNVTIKGFDGYGSVEVDRKKDDLGFYKYTKD